MIQKLQKWCSFWIQKLQKYCSFWIQKLWIWTKKFLNPEIVEMVLFLDPKIVKMDKTKSGSKNRRNGVISGSRNRKVDKSFMIIIEHIEILKLMFPLLLSFKGNMNITAKVSLLSSHWGNKNFLQIDLSGRISWNNWWKGNFGKYWQHSQTKLNITSWGWADSLERI